MILWVWLVPIACLCLGIGGYIERFRWLAWVRRTHPEEYERERPSWL